MWHAYVDIFARVTRSEIETSSEKILKQNSSIHIRVESEYLHYFSGLQIVRSSVTRILLVT